MRWPKTPAQFVITECFNLFAVVGRVALPASQSYLLGQAAAADGEIEAAAGAVETDRRCPRKYLRGGFAAPRSAAAVSDASLQWLLPNLYH